MDAPQNPFCLVSLNLRSIGALTVDAFLNNLPNDCLSDLRNPTRKASQPHGISPITRLAQACSRAFSLPNLINYELLEKDDMTGVRWKCILTINRPDGQARSYQTQFVHPRKQDARTGAANIALRLGAIEFITSFGRNSGFQREAHDTPALANDGAETVNHVEKIESLCRQWHNEQVSPQWIQFMVVDQQNRGYGAAKYGAALRVQLSPHLLELYSTDTTFLSYSEAQAMCAREAVENGVLDFIRSASSGSSEAQLASVPRPPPGSNDHTTLHIFFDALPKPFPDFPDPHAKTFAELTRAPVAYVNNALQSCRGSRFSVQYIWNSDYTHNLHGCLLRVCRPGHTKSYLVDPIFHKRNDAKSAVCLLAFSQGLGSYIRLVAEEVERQITPTMRKAVTERVLSTIASMCVKASNLIHESVQPYEYRVDNDAVGCTLKLPILATYDAQAEGQKLQFRTYTADSVYASKGDAKIAAVWQAYNDDVFKSSFQLSDSTTGPIANGPQSKRKADAELEPGELNPESSTKASNRRKRRKLAAGSHRVGVESDDEDSQAAPSKMKDKALAKPVPSAAGPSRPKPSTCKPRSAMDAGRLGGDGQARIRSNHAGPSRLTTMPMYPTGPGAMYPPPMAGPYYNVGATPDYRPPFPHAYRGDPYGDTASGPWASPYPYPQVLSTREGHHYQQQMYAPQPPSYPRRAYSGPLPAGAPSYPANRPQFIDREVEEGETIDWT